MNDEQQLQLQAFLDGELPENEAREVAAWVARDRQAADLVKELRNTRQALTGSAPRLNVPESREFYWSKIEREIRRLQPEPSAPAPVPVLTRLLRRLASAGAIAALLLIGALAALHSGLLRSSRGPATQMTVADSGTFTYCDYANGTTLVWLDYPAEK
jgi:anti-sigma factor RsiW